MTITDATPPLRPRPLRRVRAWGVVVAVLAGVALAACQPGPTKCNGQTATIVGSAGNDTLTGTAGADVIAGLAGNDTIRGLGGDDVICGDATIAGNDTISGGPGADWVSFDESGSGGRLDLAAGTSLIQGEDTLAEIENVRGGPATDRIRGDGAVNHLIAGDRDQVEGRGGNDVLDDEALCQDCRIELSYQSAPGPVTVDAGARTVTGAAGNDVLRFGPTSMAGGGSGDRFTCAATSPSCSVSGGGGPDVITGTADDDILSGNLGDDRLVGNGGSDVAYYATEPAPVTVNLQTGTATGQGSDTLVGITGVTGSDGNDTLVGGNRPECILDGTYGNDRLTSGPAGCELRGGPGNDTLTGGGGRDRIFPDWPGGTGDDRVDAGAGDDDVDADPGDDQLDGGPGEDVVNHLRSPVALDANLATGNVTGFGTDTVRNFEAFVGTFHGDTIRGSDRPEWIYGAEGADTVFGAGGNDLLFAGDGADWMHGGTGDDIMSGDLGNDTLYGGPDADTVAFPFSAPGVTADLVLRTARGPSGDDRITEFENLAGAEGDDVLRGDAGPNRIDGGDGTDACTGGGGADSLENCP